MVCVTLPDVGHPCPQTGLTLTRMTPSPTPMHPLLALLSRPPRSVSLLSRFIPPLRVDWRTFAFVVFRHASKSAVSCLLQAEAEGIAPRKIKRWKALKKDGGTATEDIIFGPFSALSATPCAHAPGDVIYFVPALIDVD